MRLIHAKSVRIKAMLLASVVGLSAVLTACGSGNESKGESADGKTELVVAALTGPVGEHIKMQAEAFMKENENVTVKVNEFDETSYKEQGPRLFLSSDKPDLAWYWVESPFTKIVESGALEPLDDLYESEGLKEVFPEAALKLYQQGGHYYAVNESVVWTPVMYYNKKAFAAAGIQPPKTMDELYQAAPKLKEAGYIPMVAGAGEAPLIGHVFEAMLQRSMPEEQFEQFLKSADFTSPEYLAALAEMKRMGSELFPKGITGMKDNEARALFVQGKAAIYSNGSWAAGSAMLGKELPQDFDLGIMLYPQLRPDVPAKIGLGLGNALMVMKGTGNEELAKKFIAFIASKERNVALANQQTLFPGRTDLTDEDLQPLGDNMIEIYRLYKEAGGTALWADAAPIELGNRHKQLLQEVVNGTRTPEQMSQEMERIRKEQEK